MLALIMGIVGLTLLPSVICAAIYKEWHCLGTLSIISAAYLIIGFCSYFKISFTNRLVRSRDGYAVVASCWFFACFLGAIAYFFSGQNMSFVDALFESTAGFTTTGATVLKSDVAAKSLLLFKASTHWMGGMGILVLVVSVLPKLGIGGQSIAMAETPTPKIEKVTDRISDTTRILYIMYISFTIIELILLLPSKMDFFDALVNTLSTISTGGFLTHDVGLLYYDSPYIETVVTVFSVLVTINFNLYYFVLNDRTTEVIKNTELRVYVIIIIICSALIAFDLYLMGTYDSLLLAIRHSITQVISFSSTSGFTFADFLSWPSFAKSILFFLMLVGGCASSTAGGLKIIRVIISMKLISRGFKKRLHPRSVVDVKLSNVSVDSKTISQITTFTMAYVFIIVIASAIMALQCPSLETAIGTTVSMISNTGVLFGDLYAVNGFNMYGPGTLLFLSLIMLIGRLEIFTILMLFVPAFWNANRQKY